VFDRQGRRKYLNSNERDAFLTVVAQVDDPARRSFCLTLFYTGCRISEALNLKAGNVDFSQKSLVFETLKRRRKGLFRSVPVPDSLIVLLRQTVEEETPVPVWNFSRPTAFRLVKGCMAEAGISGGMACPKGLRHGFAVACVAKSVPLPTLQKWLGHARLETTAIYLSVADDEERNLARRTWLHPDDSGMKNSPDSTC
jgi:integrase